MEGYDVIVEGFPSSISQVKIKIILENKIGKDTIEKVRKREDGSVGLVFKNAQGLQKFLDAKVENVTFGDTSYDLTYPQDEPAVQNVFQNQREQTEHERGPPRGDPKDADPWRRKLYVTYIPQHFLHNREALRFHFSRFGNITDFITPRAKPFVFITYFDHNEALNAKINGAHAGPETFMKIIWSHDEDRPYPDHYYQDNRNFNCPPSRPAINTRPSSPGIGHYSRRGYGPPQRMGLPPHYRNQQGQTGLPRSFSANAMPSCYPSLAAESMDSNFHSDDVRNDPRREPQNYPPTTAPRRQSDLGSYGDHPQLLMSIDVMDQNQSTEDMMPQRNHRRNWNKGKNRNSVIVEDGKTENSQLYENVHYWSDLSNNLPGPTGSMCVLAQNIDSSTDIQAVKMHFESNRRSGGGPVESIIKMNDGLLIIFKDNNDSESCAGTHDQEFDGKPLKVYRKMIPDFYDRKFVIEGVAEETKEDVLIMFLERCTKEESQPKLCEKTPLRGVYLVEYEEDEFDIVETEEFLKKVSLEKLQGNQLRASKLLHTDCLKLTEVPTDASVDEIKMTFESKKRTEGGPVTQVDRLKDGSVLVYFANFQDAERIYKRFVKPCLEVVIIANKPITIDLYYHSLSEEHKAVDKKKTGKPKPKAHSEKGKIKTMSSGPAGTVTPSQLTPKCEDNIFFFIKSSKKHYAALRAAYEGAAKVELCHVAKEGKTVKFVPEKNDGDQNKFNDQCKKVFEEFVTKFDFQSKTFDKEKLQIARSKKAHPLLEKNVGQGAEDCTIKWKKDTTVEITGLKEDVMKAMEDIEMAVEYEAIELPYSNNLLYCGIIDKLREKYEKARITCDEENKKVFVIADPVLVNQIMLEAVSSTMHDVKDRKIKDLDECVLRYLIDNAEATEQKIQDHFVAKNVKVHYHFDGEDLRLSSCSKEERDKAIEILHSMIPVENMAVTGTKADVVKSPEWKKFQQEIQSKGNYGIYLKGENIVIVGLQAEVRTVRTKIDNFLDDNAIKKDYICMSYGRAKYILERSHKFSPQSPKRKAIKCCLTPEKGGGICLEGIKKNLNAARLEINQILTSIHEQRQTLRDPGIKNYFLGTEGREFLETMSRVNNCIILPDSRDCPEWVRYNMERESIRGSHGNGTSSPVDSQEQMLASATIGRVKLAVWKTDIIKHRCDAIINASNKDLALLPGGVSGVIKNYDVKNANQIQEEMRQIVQNNFGSLPPGGAEITSAGNLPMCKKIVHAVGPRWTSESERNSSPDLVLKSCIRRSLEVTDNAGLRSIAIPAISCGVFGGKPATCIPLILDAVTDYIRDNSSSRISAVDFVELSAQNVLDEFIKAVVKAGGKTHSSKPSAPRPSPRTTSFASTSFKASTSVNLIQGDITQVNADVIVNIMAANHVQNMTHGSAIAKAIAAAAGASVVNECAQNNGQHNTGDVFRTRGGALACNEIFHGLVASYGNHSEKVVKRIVKICLQTATTAGFQSIAFPAIGTGGFKHPLQQVAKWMNDTITKYAGNLSVMIVLHPLNPQALPAFQAEFGGNASQFAGFSSSVLKSSVTYGPLTVSVMEGDITEQDADAIINSTNSNYDLTQGMISSKILQLGGYGILNELQNASGDMAITSGGNLACGNIIHLVTPSDEGDLQKKIVNVLQFADSNNLSSVAIPALGTGNIKLDSGSVGLLMRSAIEAFIKLNPRTNSLNRLDIVIYDQSMVQTFKDCILGDAVTKKGRLQKMYESVKSFFSSSPSHTAENPSETLDIYFYAGSINEITRAAKSIENETKKVMQKEVIDDAALDMLTAMENFEIEQIRTKNDVKIVNDSNKYLKRLMLVGLTKNVMKALDEIRAVLRELSEAETQAQYIAWEKKSSNGTWMELPARAAMRLEKAYKVGEKKQKFGPVQVKEFQYDKIVTQTYDLAQLTKPNPSIRRRSKEKGEADVLPSHWDDMKGQMLLQIPLQNGSPEFNKVLQKMNSTGLTPNNPIIERVQSITLYKQYAAKKAEVTKKLQGTQRQIEMELFHGTGNADKIINNGFDRSFAGSHAAAYGNGVYFATTASYSNGYAQPGSHGYRTMFLANVITGAYAQGQGGMRTPPARTNLDLYDSVVDNTRAPTMYIIFKDASAYPTYLIKYN